jgi:pyrimidine-nucleoside phosphorylase
VTARIVDLIARKRDGGELTASEIARMISDETPDEQLAAFLMAVVLRGMTDAETVALLEAMLASGERLSWPWPVADKHSTGGVGDKTTLVVAPLVAACGVHVAKMSGRGLGHTGGTIDKLESIPGMRTDLSAEEMREQVERIGIAVCGQTAELAPADGRLYALRDLTATIPSRPLLATSIMSKKIASGATRLALDVKCGEGAFLPDERSARELGELMVRLGREHGIEAAAFVSPMDEPLGWAVGNALEVEESVATLAGNGPHDLRALALEAAGWLVQDEERVRRALDSGEALETYRRWISAQGGNPDAPLPRAPVVQEVGAPYATTVTHCSALAVGKLAMRLGAGRASKGAPIDHAVGVVVHRKAGDTVEAGEPLATVHARAEVDAAEVLACFRLERRA